ncbi:MAG TPA: hypothetical protein EYG57_21150 [Planctomycetes bacterium]|nr:hypothetical protein [Planctomycetota bacterium]
MEVLTSTQRKDFEKMKGEKFDFPERQSFGRGRTGGDRGGRTGGDRGGRPGGGRPGGDRPSSGDRPSGDRPIQ